MKFTSKLAAKVNAETWACRHGYTLFQEELELCSRPDSMGEEPSEEEIAEALRSYAAKLHPRCDEFTNISREELKITGEFADYWETAYAISLYEHLTELVESYCSSKSE